MKFSRNAKYGFYLLFFFSYAIVGTIFISVFDGEYNEPFKLAAKLLSLPFAVICYGILRLEYKNDKIATSGIFYSVFCFFVLVGYGGGYLSAINSNFGHQKQIEISGVVTSKRFTEGGGRYHSGPNYYVKLTLTDGTPFEFEVSNYEYNKFVIGEEYNHHWQSGLLGLIYR